MAPSIKASVICFALACALLLMGIGHLLADDDATVVPPTYPAPDNNNLTVTDPAQACNFAGICGSDTPPGTGAASKKQGTAH